VTAVQRVFQLDLELSSPIRLINTGGRAYVRFDHGRAPLAEAFTTASANACALAADGAPSPTWQHGACTDTAIAALIFPSLTAVTVATAGITDTEWQLVVRVYVTTRTGDFDTAQDSLDDLMTATDAALGDANIPRSSWQVSYVADLECLVGSSIVAYPRDDF
jgi:hypothetical protein